MKKRQTGAEDGGAALLSKRRRDRNITAKSTPPTTADRDKQATGARRQTRCWLHGDYIPPLCSTALVKYMYPLHAERKTEQYAKQRGGGERGREGGEVVGRAEGGRGEVGGRRREGERERGEGD